MMKRFLFVTWMLVVGFAGTAFAAPFQNGSFEIGAPVSPCYQFNVGGSIGPGWTVSVGDVDWVCTLNNWNASDGAHSLDLVGSTNIGGVQQTFDTIPGATYQVQFDLAGNYGLPPVVKPLTVTVAGTTHPYTFDTTGKSQTDMGWVTQSFSFVANAPTATINFVSNLGGTGTFAGAALDNVRITLVPASTTTTLTSSVNPSTAGSSVTLTATVTGTNYPTGTVQFTDGGFTIAECSAPVTLTGTGNTMTAACTTSAFAVGSHSIVAYYGGDASNYSSQGPLTQVVNAVPIGAIPWTGSAGSVTNAGTLVPPGTLPPYPGTPIGSSPTVVSDGTAGPAVFTYETVNSNCCHTGDWTFQTTAGSGGYVGLNWTYSGYHGTCHAQASLTAFVERSGSTIFSSTPYSAYDAACSYGLPSGGFGEYGQVVLFVEPGDVYGFRMHASNYDSNGGVAGHLTVTTGALPTTTTLASSNNPTLYGATADFMATVTGSSTAPTGTVTFTQDGRMIQGCVAVPLGGGSAMCSTSGLAVGARNIVALYTGDTVNAGGVSNTLVQTIYPFTPPPPFVVDTTADAADQVPGDGVCADSLARCTLRAAIMEANASGGGRAITVPAGTYLLTLGAIIITDDVTINGAGAASTIVDGGGLGRVFAANAMHATISGLTVRNGLTNSANAGAGIVNSGFLTLNQVVVSGNTSDADGGGIFNSSGANLDLIASTVSDNVGGGGAGIYSFNGTLTLTNSTVSGNQSIAVSRCEFGGGGVWIEGGQATITSSTLFGNSAECYPGSAGLVPAVVNTGATVTVGNSILANGTGGSVCYGTVSSAGHNLFGDNSCGPVATDLVFVNPQLYPLGNYGGPTPTHELLFGSPARDAVPIASCSTTVDQQGNARPRGPACDIGAVESAPLPTQNPTTTTLASLPNPAVVGASVTYTATVTTLVSGSNPTGVVDFFNGTSLVLGTCSAVPLTGTGDSRTAVCTTSALPEGSNWLVTARYNGNLTNQSSSGTTYQDIIAAPPAVAAPALIRVVEDIGGGGTFVIWRDDSAPAASYVQAYAAASCVAGVPGPVTAIGSPVQGATNPTDGHYFGASIPGVTSGQFLAIKLTTASGTPISGVSACLPSRGDNDFWTTALLLGGESTAAGSSSVGDYIDAAGKTRWFKFRVAPGQRITVTLSGLPADYDLALFKDIGAAFAAQLAPADSTALTKLSAEFAPSAFSPSAFSPSAFSPSAFSPSAFSPSAFSDGAFSPSAFSPSAFSPSAFSPSAFSPSAFSPSAFSPSAFSPSAFSPSAFSPSAFSPSAFSQDIIDSAFSSAQTRSIIAVSATPGTVDESAVVDTWGNSGYFYARVTGRGAAFSSTGQFNIGVTKGGDASCAGVSPLAPASRPAQGSNFRTVILTDSSVLGDATLASKLLAFAGRSEIAGKVVDVGGATPDTRVQALKTQAAAFSSCPYATNLVAEEIKSIVDSFPNLRYVVIAGGDDVIPYFRYPDESLLGQESGYVPPVTGVSDASLRGDYVLSQDAYGSKTRISLQTSEFPVPGLAVGRLVKTPAEIVGMIDAYTAATAIGATTTVRPGSSLVTGYDFLADVADAITAELQSSTGHAPDTLIAANGVAPEIAWKATDLGNALFSRRHDVVFLAGHFSANSALAADFATNLITTDLAASTTDFTNSIVFSAGCHSGYSIVNRDAITGATFTLDWAQAFAQKKATLVAGTGYQYGDTDFIAYSERLYLDFAKQLRAGTGSVAIGEALVKAKQAYLAATPDIRGIHKKAVLEATLYGLPMLGVDMPSGRPGSAGSVLSPVIATDPAAGPAGATLGLRIATLNLTSGDLAATLRTQQLTGATLQEPGPLVSWLEGNQDGVVSNPAEPALPLKVVNVTPYDPVVLRGVGLRGGTYSDSTVVPLTGAPATEIRGVHTAFASPHFFPVKPWTINYFGALAGNGATSLLVTPAQHRAADLDGAGVLRNTLRSFTSLNLRLYYSGNYGSNTPNNAKQISLSDAPTIVSVGAQPATTGGVTFSAQVTGDPAAAIHQVWALYTNGGGTWVPVDLEQCIGTTLPPACGTTTDSQIWKGTASVPAGGLQYVVQAANGLGLVAFDDNRGAYYTFTGLVGPQESPQTTLAIVSAPTSAKYGDSVSVTARLTSNGQPVPGAVVNVKVGDVPNSGLTDAGGRVTLSATVASAPGSSAIVAAYGGGNGLQAAPPVTSSLQVSAAPATLTALQAPAIGVNVTAPVVTGGVTTQTPVTGQSVSFLLTSTGGSQTVVVNTDTAGNATLPTSGLPAGVYSIAATFLPASVTNYSGGSLSLPPLTMNAQTLAFTAPTPTSVTYLAPGTFAVSAAVTSPNSGQKISITSTTPTVCTVGGTPAANQANYTATIVSAGETATPSLCKLTAQIAGSGTIASAQANATIAIGAGSTTSLAVSSSSVAFGQPVTLTATVARTPGGAGTPTGTVTFKDGPTSLGAVTLASGAASLTTSSLTSGSHILTATYAGNVGGSTGTANVTVGLIPTTTTLTADKVSPVLAGTTITLTATMNSVAATGTVTFKDGSTVLGTATATAATATTAKASFPTNALGIGTHSLTAIYAGNASAAESTSAPISMTIMGAMLQARTSHTATLLNDGRVLLAGGSGAGDDDTRASRTAEIYCPSPYTPPASPVRTLAQWCPNGLGKFSKAGIANTAQVGFGNLVQARTYHSATLLPNGTVLLVGGYDTSGVMTATAEIYDPTDPAADKFTAVPNLPGNAAAGHTATLITKAGKTYVLVIGGGSAKSWLFDVQAKTWSASGNMTAVRSNHTASLVGTKVFVAGGTDALGRTLQTTTLYDIAAGTFSAGPTMLAPREVHTASAIGNNKVLLAGGRASTGIITNSVALSPLAEIYDPGNAMMPFVAKSFASGTGRFGHSASALLGANGQPDGRVLVAGGGNNVLCGQQLATSELFTSSSFAAGAPLAVKRVRHTATVLKDGRVLIAGGRGSTGNFCGPLNTAEIWNGP